MRQERPVISVGTWDEVNPNRFNCDHHFPTNSNFIHMYSLDGLSYGDFFYEATTRPVAELIKWIERRQADVSEYDLRLGYVRKAHETATLAIAFLKQHEELLVIDPM